MSGKAIVKSIISGDAIVLRGCPGPQGQPPKERILYIADVTAPRIGSSTREDEPWAFDSRDFLRAFAVGKEITFTSTHSLPPNEDVPRDFGTAEIGGQDVALELLKNGWVKVKKLNRDHTDEDNKKRDAETEAKNAGKGVWNLHGPKAHGVHYKMPTDSQAFVSEWKGKSIDALVEQVRDGSTLRVRLFMPDGEHQFINVALAGVRCARISKKKGETSEPWAEEAKFFTESRLLQRPVRVQILSLPTSTATTNTAPSPATILNGTVLYPAGNIAELLVAAGLARVADWHTGILASSGSMQRLRAAEKAAKEKRVCLYTNTPAPSASAAGHANGSTAGSRGKGGSLQ